MMTTGPFIILPFHAVKNDQFIRILKSFEDGLILFDGLIYSILGGGY